MKLRSYCGPVCIVLLLLGIVHCYDNVQAANYPEPLRSKEEIESSPHTLEDIYIAELPITNYPLLSKFTRVKRLRLNNTVNRPDVGATDAKLKALISLPFTNLVDVSLLNCPQVTDAGVKALITFASIRTLQLEGTSITDDGVNVLLNNMQLSGLNIANCPGVTVNGIDSLATSASLRDISFSARNVDQAAVALLIGRLKPNVRRCEVIDIERKLNTAALKAIAAERGIQLLVYSKGALQLLLEGSGKREKL